VEHWEHKDGTYLYQLVPISWPKGFRHIQLIPRINIGHLLEANARDFEAPYFLALAPSVELMGLHNFDYCLFLEYILKLL
jgi:hypothetical protein